MGLLLILLFGFFGTRAAIAEQSHFQWVPAGRVFPLSLADPKEIKTGVVFGGGRQIQAWVGSYLSLFSVSEPEQGRDLRMGLEGRGYFVMRQEGGRFPLETVDGTVGLFFEYGQAAWKHQLRYTHVSAHLADGSSGTAFPYSRETLSLRTAYVPGENFHLYFGLHRLVNAVPVVHPLAVQTGGSYFFTGLSKLAPFIAWDLTWQEESRYTPTFALQAGIALHEPPGSRRSFRIYYSYYTGADPRGQYFRGTQTLHSLGIELPL